MRKNTQFLPWHGATLRDNVTFLLKNVDVIKSKRHTNNGWTRFEGVEMNIWNFC